MTKPRTAILASLVAVLSIHAAEQPNIVFIFSDDHALQAISTYGGRYAKAAPTPQIDRLAKQGMVFERSYCGNSICGPSRASILTGKHSHKNGFMDNDFCSFDGTQQTFPKLMRKVGYETALIGKWHLVSEPTGFDHWEILPDQGNYYNPDFIQMDGSKTRFEGYCTDLVTDKALDWLKNRKDAKKPFILMCQHKAPHRNWLPAERHFDLFKGLDLPEPETLFDDYSARPRAVADQQMTIASHFNWKHDMLLHGEPADPRFRDDMRNGEYQRMTAEQKKRFDEAYGPENEKLLADLAAGMDDKALTRWKYQRYLKNYLRCIRAVDENVGRMLDYLDESGLAENTIVIYSSDQGFYLGEHGWYDKRWMFEESLSMPFLIRWPGVVTAGLRSKAMIQNIDYGPTFLDVAGVGIPADMQGQSIVPVLKNAGNPPEGWRDSIYYQYSGENTHRVARHDGVRNARYKLMHLPDSDEWCLFDLQKDPQEMKNVADDAGHAGVMAEMRKLYQTLRKQYGANSSTVPSHRLKEDWWKSRFQQTLKAVRTRQDVKLVFLGDSITQGWEGSGKEVWAEQFEPMGALNLGFSGDRTEHLLWRLQNGETNRIQPKVAVMLIGTNNTGHRKDPAVETASGIRAILDDLGVKWPETKVLLLAVLPRGKTADDPLRKLNDDINTRVKALADGQRVHFLDLSPVFMKNDATIDPAVMPDFLHLSPAAYRTWAQELMPELKRLGL